MASEEAIQPAGAAPTGAEHPVAEPVQNPVAEPVQNPVEEPVQNPVAEPVQHTVTEGIVSSTAAATVGQPEASEALATEEKTDDTHEAATNSSVTTEQAPQHQQTLDQQSQQQHDQTDGADFVVTAARVPIMSWGSGSAPSLPSVESQDSEMSDTDSAMGSFRSSTMSVRSSIYEFTEENGRTYHRYKAGKYHFPNDLEEQDRLDLQHALFLMTSGGKMFLAPIPEHPQQVLDIGTGTGIWAIEFAMAYPGAEVVGTDLSPIQPQYVPPNCRFEIDDAEDEWIFSQKFDFIHARAMISCFPDHKKVIQSCFDGMNPGGWCEWQDMAFPFEHVGTIPEDCSLMKWIHMINDAAKKVGRNWEATRSYKRYFEEVGFENVVERQFYWPMGYWAKGDYFKTLGAYAVEDVKRGIEPLSMKLIPLLGWSQEEIQVLIAKVRRDMEDPSIHAYLPISFVYGQKPGVPNAA